jgi:hypothetical protein
MASGTITGSTSKWTRVDISWSSTKGNGGSLVSATVKIIHTARYNYNATKSCSITINGATKSSSTLECGAISSAGTYTAISGAAWVPYTGDKSVTITGKVNLSGVSSSAGGNLGNRTTSATVALDKIGSIPSMPSFNSPATGIISETGGTINVGWSKSSSYNGSGNYDLQVSINGGSWTSVSRNIGINTTSYSYKYDAGQGNSYRFAVQCINDIGGSGFAFSNTVTTNSLTSPTIGDIDAYNPYLSSTLTVPLNDGGQANGSSIVRMCALYFDDTYITETTYDSKSLDNKSQTITYAAADYATKIGPTAYSSNKFKIVAWTQNSNGTKSNYVTKYFTVNLNTDGGAVPTLNAPVLSGGAFNNASTCFISGISTLGVSSPAAVVRRAPTGTTVSYSISCTGMTTQNVQNAKFSGLTPGSKTIKVTATDSRGLSATATTTCVVQSYFPPSIKSIKGERLSNPNTSAKVTYTISYSPIYANGKSGTDLNTITTQQYKLNNGDWANYTSGTEITKLNTELSYMVFIRVADKLRTTTYSETSVMIPTIKSGLAIRKNGVGIGVIPKDGFALDVGGKARFESDVVYVVGGRDRTPISMLTGNTTGDGIKIEAGGTVVIGSGGSPSTFISGSGISASTETTYITSDNTIRFETNLGDKYADKQEFTMHSNGQMTIPSDINLGGSLKKDGDSSSWLNGRNSAAVKMNSISGYSPAISVKTTNGSWEIGAYDNSTYTDQLIFGYVSDSDYNAGTNKQSKQYILKASGTPNGETVLTLDSAFPVGAVYITFNNNNPGNFLGGTWIQFGQGRTLMGVGSYTDSKGITGEYTEGSTGGTYNPIYAIGVTGNAYRGIGGADSYKARILAVKADMENKDTYIKGLDIYGYDKTAPYITVYFWRRTA